MKDDNQYYVDYSEGDGVWYPFLDSFATLLEAKENAQRFKHWQIHKVVDGKAIIVEASSDR